MRTRGRAVVPELRDVGGFAAAVVYIRACLRRPRYSLFGSRAMTELIISRQIEYHYAAMLGLISIAARCSSRGSWGRRRRRGGGPCGRGCGGGGEGRGGGVDSPVRFILISCVHSFLSYPLPLSSSPVFSFSCSLLNRIPPCFPVFPCSLSVFLPSHLLSSFPLVSSLPSRSSLSFAQVVTTQHAWNKRTRKPNEQEENFAKRKDMKEDKRSAAEQ